MKQRISLVAVIALAAAAGGGAGIAGSMSTERGETYRPVPGDAADPERRQDQVLCRLEGASPPA